MKNRDKGFLIKEPTKSMKIAIFVLFFLGISGLATSQDFKYFATDTVYPHVVYLKIKGEEKWSVPLTVGWHWQNERQLMEYIEESVFKRAFQKIEWKGRPALTEVGVFFRFDRTWHIDYVHFIINSRGPSRKELLLLEKNLLEYIRLIKKVDLGEYLTTDDPEKFEYGISRGYLIRKNSPVWNEK